MQGKWHELLAQACKKHMGTQRRLDEDQAERQRIEQAEAKVRLREVSRARVHLTSSGLAPGNQDTLRQFTDPELRPAHPSKQIPEEVLSFAPSQKLTLQADGLLSALRATGRGSA